MIHDLSGDLGMSCHVMRDFFFFFIQQFITQYTVVDHGSYFVTTYNRSRLHEEKEREKKKEK